MQPDTTPAPIGADAALALLVAAVEAETDPGWDCNSYHPSLWSALDVARAALASAAQPVAVPPGYVLVPVEPTAAMLQAILSEGEADAALDCPPEVRGLLIERAGVPQRYAAMLAAAPNAAPAPAAQQWDAEVLLIAAVDEWFAKNTGLGGCSDKDVRELRAIFAAHPAAPAAQGDALDSDRLNWLEANAQITIERLRRIGSEKRVYEVASNDDEIYGDGDTLRAAIDAARAAKEGAKHGNPHD